MHLKRWLTKWYGWVKDLNILLGLLGLITGLIFGVWGIHLSIVAEKKNEQASRILLEAEKNSLFVTYQNIISILPKNGSVYLQNIPIKEQEDLLKRTYNLLSQQSSNVYLVSNNRCFTALNDLRDYSFLIEGEEMSLFLAEDFYTKLEIFSEACFY